MEIKKSIQATNSSIFGFEEKIGKLSETVNKYKNTFKELIEKSEESDCYIYKGEPLEELLRSSKSIYFSKLYETGIPTVYATVAGARFRKGEKEYDNINIAKIGDQPGVTDVYRDHFKFQLGVQKTNDYPQMTYKEVKVCYYARVNDTLFFPSDTTN